MSEAATVTAKGSDAGEKFATSALLFPAATTTMIPKFTASLIDEFRIEEYPPPRLIFITILVSGFATFCCDTQSTPETTSLILPTPSQSRTRTPIIVTDGATP